MLTIEKYVTPSDEQWEIVMEGMRNPMNSWDLSDSEWNVENYYDITFIIGDADLDLAMRLRNAGTDDRKYLRMLPVHMTVNAPLYWWKEFDTYKVGTVSNSCSTMHKIHAKEFMLDDFSHEHLLPENGLWRVVIELNAWRQKYLETKDKKYWWQMIQLLPSSYNQKRTLMVSYEVLANVYRRRRNHKMGEGHWDVFCDWIEQLPHSELITGQREIEE